MQRLKLPACEGKRSDSNGGRMAVVMAAEVREDSSWGIGAVAAVMVVAIMGEERTLLCI